MIRGGLVHLSASDLGRAVRFYVETLGMKLVHEEPGFARIDAGSGFELGLRARSGSGATIAPSGIGFRVDALDDAVAIFENRGLSFRLEATGSRRRAVFEDPEGNALFLFEP